MTIREMRHTCGTTVAHHRDLGKNQYWFTEADNAQQIDFCPCGASLAEAFLIGDLEELPAPAPPANQSALSF